MVYQIGWIRLALTGSWLLDLEVSGFVRAYVSCAYLKNNCLHRTCERRGGFSVEGFVLRIPINVCTDETTDRKSPGY
ncbi:hypothetical protein P5V15_005950 [Pogonomyrmex californicus]